MLVCGELLHFKKVSTYCFFLSFAHCRCLIGPFNRFGKSLLCCVYVDEVDQHFRDPGADPEYGQCGVRK